MTISLKELKEKRAAMTQGEWERMGHTFVSPEYDVGRCDAWNDVEGVVATHNAADVLIEIAEAALAFFSSHDQSAVESAYDRLRAALSKVTP